MDTEFLRNAKISTKGQVTIPSEVRKFLGVQSGDVVTFGMNKDGVIILNRKEIKINKRK